jgi:hypothetical protein
MQKALPFAFSAVLAAGTLFAGSAGAQTVPAGPLPFNDFLQDLSGARFETYASQAGHRVRSAQSFEEMRGHIFELYKGITVNRSFLFGPDTFDCVPIMQQPTVRALGLLTVAQEPPAPPTPKGLDRSLPTGGPSPIQTGQLESARTKDTQGNYVACLPGTIPMRRITLDELSRFETLHQFFQKYSDGSGSLPPKSQVPPPADNGHRYAHAYQNIVNYGGSSDINLWDPTVGVSPQCQPNLNRISTCRFSLSQVWYSNSYRTNILKRGISVPTNLSQTAEVGWQKFENILPNYCKGIACGLTIKPRLFVFFTADGYRKSGWLLQP